MISVALCTYNGSRFLGEQLASIEDQSRPIDELVVCDDRSTDDTVAFLREFATRVTFPVHIHVNETNLGSTKNFEKALSLCKGDVIFCCDQDDIWRSDKVEVLTSYLESHLLEEAVFTNARIIDDHSEPVGRTIWDEIEFGPEKQMEWLSGRGYETLFGSYVVTGATLALRRRILPLVTPFPTALRELIHDGWIALVLSLTNRIGFVNDTLIDYRQHTHQQVGFGKKARWVTLQDRLKRDRQEKIAPLRSKAEHAAILYDLLRQVPGVPDEKLNSLQERKAHFDQRASLPEPRWQRIVPIWKEYRRGRYQMSSPEWWRPVLGDLLE